MQSWADGYLAGHEEAVLGGRFMWHRVRVPGVLGPGSWAAPNGVVGRPLWWLLSAQGSLALWSQTAWKQRPIALSSSQAPRPNRLGLRGHKAQMPARAAG